MICAGVTWARPTIDGPTGAYGGPYPLARVVRWWGMSTPARRLYVSMIVSLDGCIEDPDHDLSWFQDGDPAFELYCDEMIDSVGLAVFGRKSYELMVSSWPRAEGPFAAKMNALPKFVLSRTLASADWAHTTVVRDVEQIAALKRTEGKPIVAWAGAGLVASLAKADLIDEYRLIVHPIVLGGGTPMFGGGARQQLRLVRTTQLGEKLAMLCYQPLRA
jgi:dihydrofolate reductase